MADPIDYLGLMGGLGPSYIERELGLQTIDQNRNILAKQEADRAAAQQAQIIAQRRAQQKQIDFDAVLGNPTAEGFARLHMIYPEDREALKSAWDTKSEDARATDLRELSAIRGYLQSGNKDKAIARLERRIAADRAAGQDVTDDEEMIELIRTNEGGAGKFINYMLSAVEPEKFAATLSALDPSTEFQRQYDFIAEKYGQPAADRFAENKYDPVVPITTPEGTTAYRSSQLSGGASPSPVSSASSSPEAASDKEAASIVAKAKRSKFITPEDFARIEAALGPQGRERAQQWLAKQGVQVGKVVGGKRYVKRGNDWFEVGNAEGN